MTSGDHDSNTSEASTEQPASNGAASVDVEALNTQLSEFKRKAWEADQRAQTLEERYKGIDPEAHKALREDYDNLRAQGAVGDKDAIDSLIAEKETRLQQEYGTKIDDLERSLASSSEKLAHYEVVIPMREIGKDFLPDAFKYLDPVFAKHCRVADGEIIIVDDAGEVRKSKNDPRINMLPQEFVEELKEQNPFMVQSSMKSGHMPNTGEKINGFAGGDKLKAYMGMNNAERRANFTIEERDKLSRQALKS